MAIGALCAIISAQFIANEDEEHADYIMRSVSAPALPYN